MKLPKTVFVKIGEGDEPYLIADETLRSLMSDDDGPTTVGVYRLERLIKADKKVQFKPIK